MTIDIIVAGGGIAGAAVALFLSRLDTKITILEGRPCRQPTVAQGGMIMLGPNGMNVLDGLGLASTLLQRTSLSIPYITVTDGEGGPLGRVSQGTKERYGFASTMVLRAELHDVLLDEAEKRRLDVQWGAQVQSVHESDDGVRVRWAQKGETHERTVALLIGADGIWSTVRPSLYAALELPFPKPVYSGLLGIGTLVDVASVPGLADFLSPERPCVMMHGRQGFVGVSMLDESRTRVGWWTTHEAPDRERQEWKIGKKQAMLEMRERYSDWAFPVPQLIAAAEASDAELLIWPIFQVSKLQRWHGRRTVLIGDAAHAMPPHSGQGASQALEDAGYLANLVRKHIESGSTDWTSTLATFQKERQPRVNSIVDVANRRGGMKKNHSMLGYIMRKWMMWILFSLLSERWGDDWFGYKVPGINEW